MVLPSQTIHGSEEDNSKEFRKIYALLTKLQKDLAALADRVAVLEGP